MEHSAAQEMEQPKKLTRQQKREARSIVLGKKNQYYDYSLLAAIIFLNLFGLLMVFSASSYSAMVKTGDSLFYLKKQLVATGIGFVAMIFVSKVDYHKWAILSYPACLASIVLMILVDFTPFGIEYNGQKRWFGIAGHSLFQAAEPVKIALILTTAFLCVKYRKHINEYKKEFVICAFQVIPVGLVAIKNLSSGIILLGILFAMLFVASKVKGRYLLLMGAGVALIVLAYFFAERLMGSGILKEYQISRILVWKDPVQYSENGGYQVLQGLYAIGSGGFFGKGIGQSMQKLGFVPEAQNDMVFTIVCEELGVFGAVCLIALFVFLLWRCLVIAQNAPDMYGGLLVTGVMAHIAIQVVLNIAVVTNCIPNTGVTLPFISYGGTSVCFLLFELGLVLSVASRIKLEE